MEKCLLVSGEVVFSKMGATKNGKAFYAYQIESTNSERGKQVGWIKSWVDRKYTVGQNIMAAAWESVRIWNDKIISEIILLKPEEEINVLTMLGIKAPVQAAKGSK